MTNRVKTTTTTVGTGDITVAAGAATRYRPLADIQVGRQATMMIEDEAGTEWELSKCTILSATTFSRDVVLNGSAGPGVKVNFAAGTKTVFATMGIDQFDAGLVNPNDPGFDIILGIGQSNMVSQSASDTAIDVVDPRVFAYGGYVNEAATYRKITQAVDPLRHNFSQATLPGQGNGSGMSPLSWIGKTYAGMIPSNRKVLLVPMARSNTKLFNDTKEWFPGDGSAGSGVALGTAACVLFDAAVDQAIAAIAEAQKLYPNSRFVGTAWLQGEGDADFSGLSTQINYAGALKTLIYGLRKRIPGAANSWFVIGGLAPENIADTANKIGYSRVDAAHRQVAAEFPRVAFAPGAGPGLLNGDNLHYNTLACRINGCRMGSAIPVAIASRGVDTTAPETRSATVYASNASRIAWAVSEPVDPNYVPSASAFTVGGHPVSAVSVEGNYVYLTVTTPFVNGEAARTLAYTAPASNGLRDLAGNVMANASQSIVNNVAAVPTVASVTISPTTPTLAGGAQQQFTATVTGTGSPAQTVTWSMTGAGSLSASGLYTAPAATSSDQTATITATSTVDGTKSASTTVTISAATASPTVSAVSVSPSAPTVSGGATQQFTATVAGTGSPAQTVTWSMTGAGSISASGLYTAPAATSSAQSATITATSTVDNTKSGTATVTVPATAASAGNDLQFPNLVSGNMNDVSAGGAGTAPYTYQTAANQNFAGTAQGGSTTKTAAGDFTLTVKINTVAARHMIGFKTGAANIAYGSIPYVFWAETGAGGGYKLRGTATSSPGVGRAPVNNDLVRISRTGTTVTAEVSSDNGATWATILTWTQSGTLYCQILSEGNGQFIGPVGTGWA